MHPLFFFAFPLSRSHNYKIQRLGRLGTKYVVHAHISILYVKTELLLTEEASAYLLLCRLCMSLSSYGWEEAEAFLFPLSHFFSREADDESRGRSRRYAVLWTKCRKGFGEKMTKIHQRPPMLSTNKTNLARCTISCFRLLHAPQTRGSNGHNLSQGTYPPCPNLSIPLLTVIIAARAGCKGIVTAA